MTIENKLLSRRNVAELLSVSLRTFDRLNSAGFIPRPVELRGSTKRWSRTEIDSWIAAGCPPRLKWDAIQGKKNRRGN